LYFRGCILRCTGLSKRRKPEEKTMSAREIKDEI
jgi:hypothetical protein